MKTNDPQDGVVSIKPRGRQNLISQKNEFKSKFKKPKAFIKPKPSGKKTFHHYNHLEGDRDTKFTSNITGAEWAKYSFAKWSKVIDQKGVVHQCNHLSSLVWHTKGQNTSGIGIVVLGNFEGPTYKGTNSPTDTQIKNTNRLIDFLLKKTDIKIESSEIYGHADFGKENCPGNKVYTECVESRRK